MHSVSNNGVVEDAICWGVIYRLQSSRDGNPPLRQPQRKRCLRRLADPIGGCTCAGEDRIRINRLAAGNFGDCKPPRWGRRELRIDWGPGYRVYYAMIGRERALLLCGGDKRRQLPDIERALEYFQDYKERSAAS